MQWHNCKLTFTDTDILLETSMYLVQVQCYWYRFSTYALHVCIIRHATWNNCRCVKSVGKVLVLIVKKILREKSWSWYWSWKKSCLHHWTVQFVLNIGGVVGYKSWGQEVVMFRQTDANFRQRRLRVLKSLTLPLNAPSPKTILKNGGFSGPNFVFLKEYFRQE